MKNFRVPNLEVPAFAAANRQAAADLTLLRKVIEASKVSDSKRKTTRK